MGETPKETVETLGETCRNTRKMIKTVRKTRKQYIEGITMIITGI